jgi:hypothetical protein
MYEYVHTQMTDLLPNALVIGGVLAIYVYSWRKTALISIVLTSLVVPPSLYILCTNGEVGYFLSQHFPLPRSLLLL